MKILSDILEGIDTIEIQGAKRREINRLDLDSSKVQKGSLFAAIKGTRTDGHKYIRQAIDRGAQAILCEEIPFEDKQTTFIRVKNSAKALGIATHNFYDHPTEKLNLIGITGTNGKTTTAIFLHQVFQQLGYPAGLLSTIEIRTGNKTTPASLTTPDPVGLNKTLKEMVDHGIRWAFMEVSSHALVQHRTAGLRFAGAVFTNITHDHLDYHATFQDYILAKKKLFDGLDQQAFALVNIDDKRSKVMVQNSRAKTKTFGLKKLCDYKGRVLENDFDGMQLEINDIPVYSRLTGTFNAYNLIATYGAARESGIGKEDALHSLSLLKTVEGRFDRFKNKEGITGIVDYAHTPDALENVLQNIKDVNRGHGKVITVVGCGGNRDKEKRPHMARIAISYSSQVILTSDNPRDEDPASIIEAMEKGIPKDALDRSLSIPGRNQAIKTACQLASPGDIILVAGKGHEKYQEIKGVKKPFDDKLILKEYLN